MKTTALKVGHWKFADKTGKEVNTSVLVVNLGKYGTANVCSELANDYDLFTEINVFVSVNDRNKLVIKSIEK